MQVCTQWLHRLDDLLQNMGTGSCTVKSIGTILDQQCSRTVKLTHAAAVNRGRFHDTKTPETPSYWCGFSKGCIVYTTALYRNTGGLGPPSLCGVLRGLPRLSNSVEMQLLCICYNTQHPETPVAWSYRAFCAGFCKGCLYATVLVRLLLLCIHACI